MIRRTFTMEERLKLGVGNEYFAFKVEVYRWQVFGLTIWKTEKLY